MSENNFSCTRFILIRHGDTVDEETHKIYKGTLDVPLSEKGIERLTKVSRFLKRYKIDTVYSSTLVRSIKSAEIIIDGRNICNKAEKAFNEIGFGKFEGHTFFEIQKKYPRQLKLWLENPVANTPPDGEHLLDVQSRVMNGFLKILEEQNGKTIAIVSHGGVLKIIFCTLLEIELWRMHRFAQDYGCINIIDVYPDGNVVIQLLNYTVGLT